MWVHERQTAAAASFSPHLYLVVLHADRAWREMGEALMKQAEQSVTTLLNANPQKFAAFRMCSLILIVMYSLLSALYLSCSCVCVQVSCKSAACSGRTAPSSGATSKRAATRTGL